MNTIILVGRTTKDIEIKTLSSGSTCANFCVAVDRRTSKDKVTDFIDCVAWGKTADIMAQYVRKGDRIGVQGSLQTRQYEDRDGNKRKAVEVLVDRIEFLSVPDQAQSAPDPQPVQAPAQVAAPEPSGELPFEI